MADFNQKKNELAIYDRDEALQIANLLINNGYIVMLSEEENLTIINFESGYEYSASAKRVLAGRNDVVFLSNEDFEEMYFEENKEEEQG